MKYNRQLTFSEISSFCSQMALLIQAGITPQESMRVLLNDCHSAEERKLFTKIFNVCDIGASFHDALESTKAFPPYCLNLIALGEEAGELDVCLQSLSSYYEREKNFRNTIRNSLTYPFIMIIVMLVVMGILLIKVLPAFSSISTSMGIPLTGFAATFLNIGTTVSKYAFLILIVIFILFLLFILFLKIAPLKNALMNLLYYLPFTKKYFDGYAKQRFASGMALSLSSGIDAFGSLDLVADLVCNPVMKEKVLACKARIRDGSTLADALIDSKILNHLHSRMITIGFRSGTIDRVMQQIADIYEKENEKRRNDFLAALQPTCIMLLTILLGMMLISILLSITSILSNLTYLF